VREELQTWANTYPKAPGYRDGTFTGASAAAYVSDVVPEAIRTALGQRADRYHVGGSAGQSDWTHTPWVALLDPASTTTVQDGIYVVYLMSLGTERLYLSLNQGCTALRDVEGHAGAREELLRRAGVMRKRVQGRARQLKNVTIDLVAKGWRAELYEVGQVLTREYRTSALPEESELRADLEEALALYRMVLRAGGWTSDEVIVEEARDEAGIETLTQAKLYNQHRRIERNPSHSRKVKDAQGSTCKACGIDPVTIYGELAAMMVDAHHLRPLSALEEGTTVTYDVMKDFAVLCPNCHRAIHRMEDVGDIEGLQKLLTVARS